MTTHVELQEEEREVLTSIYDSDPNFKETGPQSFQYKVGSVGEAKSCLVEVQWTDTYPDELPSISLDAFFNNHLSQTTKSAIIQTLLEEANNYLGSPMTYSLFEYLRENQDDLIIIEEKQEEEEVKEKEDNASATGSSSSSKADKVKGPQLSKAAKRRQADKLNSQRGLPRGHDWVCIVRLSQTGSKGDSITATSSHSISVATTDHSSSGITSIKY